MKTLITVLALAFLSTSAFAATNRVPASNDLAKKAEKAVRDGIAKEMTFKVETAKASICGGEEADAVFVTVFMKKMEMSENGPKETKEEFDHFGAYAKDFKKDGFKAFMRNNQCME